VKALVYVATFAPDAHEVVTAYGGKYPSRLNSALRPDSAGFLTVDRAQFQELFASLCLQRWPSFNGPHIMSLVPRSQRLRTTSRRDAIVRSGLRDNDTAAHE
jgi:hypothetical protein